MIEKCFFCQTEIETDIVLGIDEKEKVCFCPSCGKYTISLRHLGYLDNYIEKGKLKDVDMNNVAGYLCEEKIDGEINIKRQSPKSRISYSRTITYARFWDIVNGGVFPQTSMQKLDKLLLNIYKSGNGFAIEFDSDDLFPAMGYVRTQAEISKMIDALCELGFVKYMNYAGGKSFAITIKGLERAENLLEEQNISKKIFVAMKFNDEMRDILNSAIKPACLHCGFEAFAVDEKQYLGGITDRIIAEIKTSRFVIADFTENNNGVYYEAGFANGVGVPVIQTCKKAWFDSEYVNKDTGKKEGGIHFDVRHNNTILWENAEDLKQKLIDRIKALSS